MICQLIYFPVSGEKGGLCCNDLNNPKLNHVPTENFNLNNSCVFQVSTINNF